MARIWTEKEIDFLNKNVSIMTIPELARVFDVNTKTVFKKVKELGLKSKDGRFKEKLKIGDKYGLFTIIGTTKKITGKNAKSGIKYLYYICECECKRIKEVPKFNLINGNSYSCGCVGRGENTLPPGEATLNEKYVVCKYGAQCRDLSFDLTKEQYVDIVTGLCFYCGECPKPYNRYLKKDGSKNAAAIKSKITQHAIDNGWANINTVDRINSDLGYSVENCVPSCWPCNLMKMDSVKDDFIDQVYKIVAYQESKKQKCS